MITDLGNIDDNDDNSDWLHQLNRSAADAVQRGEIDPRALAAGDDSPVQG